MGSYEVFCTVMYKYAGFHSKFVGHDISVPSFKPNVLTKASVTLWYSCAILTMFDACTGEPEVAFLNVFCLLFAIQVRILQIIENKYIVIFNKLQGITKSHLILTKTKELQKMMNFISELHTVNKNNYDNGRVLMKFARWNLLLTKFIVIVFAISFSVAIISPIPIYLITGNVEPMLPIHIPFVNLETRSGYVLQSTYVFFLIVSAYCGTTASELLLIMLTIQLAPMANIFDKAINGLNEATGGKRQEAIKNSTWLRESVRKICLMHKEIYL